MEQQWQIKSGPSKFDLMQAVFHRDYGEVKVTMKIQKGVGKPIEIRRLTVLIVSRFNPAERNPQLWRIVGYLDCSMMELLVVGEYSTRSRKGWLSQVDDALFEYLKQVQLVF
jgi:hypothetical protein